MIWLFLARGLFAQGEGVVAKWSPNGNTNWKK
jgi:hypothetical protein